MIIILQELELIEEQMCVAVFPRFLKFLYGCNIKLNLENSLPILVLADKYNVSDLQNVCISFACIHIIPKLQLKDVFYVWFQYATKCYHRRLVHSCIKAMAEKMDEIMGWYFCCCMFKLNYIDCKNKSTSAIRADMSSCGSGSSLHISWYQM